MIKSFDITLLEELAKILCEMSTHKQLTSIFERTGIDDVLGQGPARWRRILHSLDARQKRDQCGNNVGAFIQAMTSPVRFSDADEYNDHRVLLNEKLAFHGLFLDEKGMLTEVSKAETITEAKQRASELRYELLRRGVHQKVLKFCSEEFLQENYFHCVLEASKSIAAELRDKTGLSSDGSLLIDAAFSIKAPMLAINTLQSESEESEHKGFASLLRGIMGTFRNVTAHAPKIDWAVNREDALDALTIISYAHKRIDQAVVVGRTL